MRIKFIASIEIIAYTAGDLIECLECGKKFSFLANHLRRAHGIDSDEYRESWGIPAMTPLAGQAYRAAHREKFWRMQADGTITYGHLPRAAAKSVGRPRAKVGVAVTEHTAMITKLRPGDAHLLPPGAKRADGRDADIARSSQQRRRSKNKGSK